MPRETPRGEGAPQIRLFVKSATLNAHGTILSARCRLRSAAGSAPELSLSWLLISSGVLPLDAVCGWCLLLISPYPLLLGRGRRPQPPPLPVLLSYPGASIRSCCLRCFTFPQRPSQNAEQTSGPACIKMRVHPSKDKTGVAQCESIKATHHGTQPAGAASSSSRCTLRSCASIWRAPWRSSKVRKWYCVVRYTFDLDAARVSSTLLLVVEREPPLPPRFRREEPQARAASVALGWRRGEDGRRADAPAVQRR